MKLPKCLLKKWQMNFQAMFAGMSFVEAVDLWELNQLLHRLAVDVDWPQRCKEGVGAGGS